LDLSPPDIFSNLVYDAVFTRGGVQNQPLVEVFRSQCMVGYTMIVTGAKGLGDAWGFTVERNTRFISHPGQARETLAALEAGTPLNGWTLRKVLEEEESFDAAMSRVAAAPFASTEYDIMSGAQAGVVLAKSLEGTAHTITLGGGASDYVRCKATSLASK